MLVVEARELRWRLFTWTMDAGMLLHPEVVVAGVPPLWTFWDVCSPFGFWYTQNEMDTGVTSGFHVCVVDPHPHWWRIVRGMGGPYRTKL